MSYNRNGGYTIYKQNFNRNPPKSINISETSAHRQNNLQAQVGDSTELNSTDSGYVWQTDSTERFN